MEPSPIRYVASKDSLRIAYWTLGGGPRRPLVFVPSHAISIEFAAAEPDVLEWYSRIAADRLVVKYDARGVGLSDPMASPNAATLDREVEDLRALVDRLDLRDFDLWGDWGGARVALEYAKTDARVAHIVAWRPVGLEPDSPVRRVQGVTALRSIGDRELWARNMGILALGDRPEGDLYAREVLHGVQSLEQWQLSITAAYQTDRFDSHGVGCPVLVLFPGPAGFGEDVEAATLARVQRLAKELADARFRRLANTPTIAHLAPIESVWPVVDAFLSENRAPAGAAASPFRTILFTDVVSSTPLLAQLKDAKMREIMHEHDLVLEAAVTGNGGRVIKTIGDAFMAEFAVPSAAVEAAIAAQRNLRERFADSDVPVRIRVGINAGEPIEEDGDLHGASVVIAKRLESAADVNGILVSDVVKQMVTGKDFAFEDRGEVALKGFEETVRAWAVRWE